MRTGKYTSDFRLENVEIRGRLVTRPVYRGDWFEFVKSQGEMRKYKIIFSICSLISALFFAGALFLNTSCGHCFYVMIPFAALIFPEFFSLAALRRLLLAKGKVTREHKDKTGQRYISVSVLMMAFSAISLIGHIVYIFLYGDEPQGVVFLVLTTGILACAVVMFHFRNGLEMKKAGSAAMPEEYYK